MKAADVCSFPLDRYVTGLLYPYVGHHPKYSLGLAAVLPAYFYPRDVHAWVKGRLLSLPGIKNPPVPSSAGN